MLRTSGAFARLARHGAAYEMAAVLVDLDHLDLGDYLAAHLDTIEAKPRPPHEEAELLRGLLVAAIAIIDSIEEIGSVPRFRALTAMHTTNTTTRTTP
jgi:hypothetical protein